VVTGRPELTVTATNFTYSLGRTKRTYEFRRCGPFRAWGLPVLPKTIVAFSYSDSARPRGWLRQGDVALSSSVVSVRTRSLVRLLNEYRENIVPDDAPVPTPAIEQRRGRWQWRSRRERASRSS